MDTNEYIKDQFIQPNLTKIGLSSYAVRSSLKMAVDEVKSEIEGIVIDLGCGEMPYREYMLREGNITKYIGIDLKPTEYHGIVKPDLYWDGQTIPLPDNHANWVLITEFLEHYFDTQHILKEIYRVLKPGGHIFFTVPFIYPLHEVPYDEYRFTPFSLEKHFKLAGFQKTTVKSLGGINRSLAILIGVWKEHFNPYSKRRYKRYLKRIFIFLLVKFYKYLLETDTILMNYSNHKFSSGFWGIVEK
jgi:SAM-dependent methyltransferase